MDQYFFNHHYTLLKHFARTLRVFCLASMTVVLLNLDDCMPYIHENPLKDLLTRYSYLTYQNLLFTFIAGIFYYFIIPDKENKNLRDSGNDPMNFQNNASFRKSVYYFIKKCYFIMIPLLFVNNLLITFGYWIVFIINPLLVDAEGFHITKNMSRIEISKRLLLNLMRHGIPFLLVIHDIIYFYHDFNIKPINWKSNNVDVNLKSKEETNNFGEKKFFINEYVYFGISFSYSVIYIGWLYLVKRISGSFPYVILEKLSFVLICVASLIGYTTNSIILKTLIFCISNKSKDQ